MGKYKVRTSFFSRKEIHHPLKIISESTNPRSILKRKKGWKYSMDMEEKKEGNKVAGRSLRI